MSKMTTEIMDPLSRSYCIIGKPGTGKTTSLKTFRPEDWTADKDPWAYVYACDRKKHGGMTVLLDEPGMEFGVFVNQEARMISSVKTPSKIPEPHALSAFITQFNEHDELAEKGALNYAMMSIDTASGFTDIIFEELMYKERTLNPAASAELKGRQRPSLSEIGDCQWYLMQYIKAFLQFPCITVVVCHTAGVQEDLEGKVKFFPHLPGVKINDPFLAMFDEVYFFEHDNKGNVVVRTRPTITKPARTSLPLDCLKELEEPDYQVWKAKMEKLYEHRITKMEFSDENS